MEFISDTYMKMLDKDSMHIARDFLNTEREFLKSKLSHFKHCKQAVVVGCGNYNYYELIESANIGYLGIDPYAPLGECSQLIKITFEEYLAQRKDGENKIFILWFNVISHLDINLIAQSHGLRKGDVIINSTWCKEIASRNVLEQYYASILPNDQKNYFSADIILSRERSIKGMLRAESSFSTQKIKFNLFEVAIV